MICQEYYSNNKDFSYFDRVVAVVCGGCIDREVLMEIIDKVDQSKSKLGADFQTKDHYTIHARRS